MPKLMALCLLALGSSSSLSCTTARDESRTPVTEEQAAPLQPLLRNEVTKLIKESYIVTNLSAPASSKVLYLGSINFREDGLYDEKFMLLDEGFRPKNAKDKEVRFAMRIEVNEGLYKVLDDGQIQIFTPRKSSCAKNLMREGSMSFQVHRYSQGEKTTLLLTSSDPKQAPLGERFKALMGTPLSKSQIRPLVTSPTYANGSELMVTGTPYAAYYGCFGDESKSFVVNP